MRFYILLQGQSKEALLYDSAQLGDTTAKSFYPNRGFTKLCRIIEDEPDLLEHIEIFDDTQKEYSVQEFLNLLKKYIIQQH